MDSLSHFSEFNNFSFQITSTFYIYLVLIIYMQS